MNLIRKLKEDNLFSRKEDLITFFDIEFPIEDMEDKKIQEKRFQLLQKEIKNLDAQKRELLFLKFNSGLTYSEIGGLLKINPDTAKKQVYRF